VAADRDFDYRLYQHICVVYAGNDQSVTNKTTDLWPQFWSGLNVTTQRGWKVNSAFYVSENDPVGTYAHEFGHSLGLPDLYPKDRRKIDTVRQWSLMDSGEWGGNPPGSAPTGLDAWSLTILGWLTPVEVSARPEGTSVDILPLVNPNGTRAVKIPLNNTMYYLLELRMRRLADSSLPFDSVEIYKIDLRNQMGYDAYGLLNMTGQFLYASKDQIQAVFSDDTNKVFIQMIGCVSETCTLKIASRMIRVSVEVPASVEILMPVQVKVKFVDQTGRPIQKLNFTFTIDGTPVQLELDENGEANYTVHFNKLGRHTVHVNITGIEWPIVADPVVEAQPPYTPISLVITALVAFIIFNDYRKRRSRDETRVAQEILG
jgi:hypothetical protein